MSRSPHKAPEALLEHTEWMRALARRLVHGAGAEDVVQDAWVQALEHEPGAGRDARGVRAWLGGVLRNLARQRHRADERRRGRERRAARPEASAGSAVDELTAHQDVVQAVLTLREPYRRTVVQRFYEGLTPERIARRERVPVTTVKSRLTRGLHQLRERLAREYGGAGKSWALALAPLLARPSGLLKTLTSTWGVWTVNTTTKVSITAVAFVGLVWTGFEVRERITGEGAEPRGVVKPLEPAPAAGSEREGTALVAAPDGDEREPVVEPSATTSDSTSRPASSASAATSRPDEAPGFPLRAAFLLPDRTELTLDDVQVRLVDRRADVVREARGQAVGELRVEDVPYGKYRLTVQATGYRHVAETLDYPGERALENGGRTPGGPHFFHRVTLWPADWIPVIVKTRDGRPFRALTDDVGLEPRRYFVDAFQVAVSTDPFDESGPYPGMVSEAAVYRFPKGYQSVELGGSIAGSIQLLKTPPVWVGLWLHGVFFEARMLRPGDTEVEFAISLDDLLARFASLTMKLVDRDTGVAVVDASATLKAETSAHRRDDLRDVGPNEEGVLTFERVIPGPHDLTITREGHVIQRKIDFAPAQRVDLGVVEIGSGPGIRVVIVDEEGQPTYAWLELAPYEAGRATDDLYHPNLHRTTQKDGTYALPIPDRVSILRARPMGDRSDVRGYMTPPVGTPNVLIDPDDPPIELRVQARPRVDVRFDPLTPWEQGDLLWIVDELDLIVASVSGRTAEQLEAKLVAGSYRVVRRRAGEELGSIRIVVDPDDPRVLAP